MSRRPLLAKTSISVLASFATTLLLCADNPPITAPPGYKVVYHDMGNGKKMPILVQLENDPAQHSNLGEDPLDHQKVFSETNQMANKTFSGADGTAWNKGADEAERGFNSDKVYDTSSPGNIFNTSSKPTFATAAYEGVKSADGADTSFTTKTADIGNTDASSAFAAIGAEQNQSSPIGNKTYAVGTDALAQKSFQGPEEEARHRHLKKLDNGQLLIDNLPERPLSIDEVKNLINHGFKPDLTQPPPPASKPLNDPNYQPEPLRIEPTEAETPTPVTNSKVDDDDKDDPVPPPGTMADPSGPLPDK